MARSATLILLALLCSPGQAQLCANPGQDGDQASGPLINSYFTGPDSQTLPAGSNELPLTVARGNGRLHGGDLALLIQMQGADIRHENHADYGQLLASALHQEWVSIVRVSQHRARIRGAGDNGGLRYSYRNAPADKQHGRARWQLIRVPQYQSLIVQEDLKALPWDGRTGGVLAMDVRRQLDLQGHSLSVAGAGFRGGQALSLSGALGRPQDWRYPAPSEAERQAGYGQHGSKGEGVAGSPAAMTPDSGYPGGDMGRGAPVNAGGGGNGLDLSQRHVAGGGGGGNAGAGQSGSPAEGGGQGGASLPPGLIAGGGGGAAARRDGQGGNGGNGGGILVIRAARLVGPGTLDLRGAAGQAARAAGGGGGAGGTLWLSLPPATALPLTLNSEGGEGGHPAGGKGGVGALLSSRPRAENGFRDLAIAGPEAGYACQPAGHWASGTLFEDNGAGQVSAAFHGRHDEGETFLSGWPVALLEPDGKPLMQTRTDPVGGFVLRLDEADSHGQPLLVQVTAPVGWSLPRPPALDGNPGRQQGRQWRWPIRATADQHSGPLNLGWLARPGWQGPADRQLAPGATAVLTFHYQATVSGAVRFGAEPQPAGSLLMDRNCSGDSEEWQASDSPWWPVHAGEQWCVRMPVKMGEQSVRLTVSATTRPAGQTRPWPAQAQTVNLQPAP